MLLMNILLKESNTMNNVSDDEDGDKLIRCELDGIFRRKNISHLPGSAQCVDHLIW